MLVGRVAVELRPVREIIRKKGLMPGGAVQRQDRQCPAAHRPVSALSQRRDH